MTAPGIGARVSDTAPLHIAVLGAGQVGGTLGRRWAALGHVVTFGVRDPTRGDAAVKGALPGDDSLPSTTSLATPSEALRPRDGRRPDAVVLATPWSAVPALLAELGSLLDGLPLLDATNPLGPGLRLDVGPRGESGGERVQAMAPGARVVKAYNTTGYGNMRDPAYAGARTVMLHAGDDVDAKRLALALSVALGFEAVDAGPLARARELEHLATLWIALAYGADGAPALGRDFAFGLLRR